MTCIRVYSAITLADTYLNDRIENPFLSQSKNNLIKNFPTTLLSSIKARLSPQRGRYAGWRVGVLFAIMGVSFVLVINVIVTIWACIRYSVIDELGTIYEGSCSHTKTLSRWIHFGINALSTVALSGSNYTQQCLMSPSREEVDRAHLKGKWLDIGCLVCGIYGALIDVGCCYGGLFC